MINKNNKGMVLGLTFISMLSILIMVSILFTIVFSKNLTYKRYTDKINEKITISKYAQEVYVNIINNLDDVQNSYKVEDLIIDVSINFNDNYKYQIDLFNLTLFVIVDSNTGEIITWKIT